MARRIAGLGRDQRGVAAMEFAIVASALIALILGVIGAGLLWWMAMGLQVTADLTARCAALGSCPNGDPKSYAVEIANQWAGTGAITSADVTVTTGSPCHAAAGGYSNFAIVSISGTPWAADVLPAPWSKAITVTACFPIPS